MAVDFQCGEEIIESIVDKLIERKKAIDGLWF